MTLHPVILAGGSGTRLWPLSREFYPKPFLSISDSHSMLQDTVLRLDGVDRVMDPIVVCNEEHRFLVAEHSRQIDCLPVSILLEPVGRNTAPALTLAALTLSEQASNGDSPVMLVLPADHVISDVEAFQRAVAVASELADHDYIVTFGITPSFPSVGYGYIRSGDEFFNGFKHAPYLDTGSEPGVAYQLAEFVEKPDIDTACSMIETEEYLWNSGMFVLRASAWLEEIERFRPDIADACRSAHASGTHDGLFFRPDPETFEECPPDTIDYAVMERIVGSKASPRALVVPIDAGWSDVGSWAAIMDVSDKDDDGNVVRGDVYTHDMRNSMIFGHHRLVAAVGLKDVIVVDTPDAVLAADRNRAEDVRDLVEQLKAEGRPERENHRRVHRPWGWYEVIDSGDRFQVKRLTVNPGQALSLQMHHHRSEHWVVVSGTAKIIKDDGESLLFENESAYVKVGETHRLENPGTIPLEIIEVQSGSYLGEDDIVRFDDRYNRG